MNQKSEETFNTPILFITFNRPNHTRRVFEEIKKQHPQYLYIFQDGPRDRNDADIEKCANVRAIFSEPMDWNCKLKTFISNENLGCGKGPVAGISWFFENEEEGIIMEDDSIPHPDFFEFCSKLLDRYRFNDKVKVIGSTNFQQNNSKNSASYYFSMQNGCFCTWATWKRTWNDFDYYLKKLDIKEFKNKIKQYDVTLKEYVYWIDIFNHVKRNRFNESCWDYQLMFSIWESYGLGIIPNVNLSTNIGFDQEATHTNQENHPGANNPTESIFPLVYNDSMNLNRKADLYYHNFYYQPKLMGKQQIMMEVVFFNKLFKSLFNINQSWKNHFKRVHRTFYKNLILQKTKIKNKLIWNKQGRILRRKIINYYSPLINVSDEEIEVVNYLKKNKIDLLPYEFKKKYRRKDVEVFKDLSFGLNYVLFNDKKLYYRKDWSEKEIKAYHSNLLSEQDPVSPHCYLFEKYVVNNGNVLVDAGAAEGIFGLMNIEKVKKVFLIEPDPFWVEALKLTFYPWIKKTVILDKFISSNNSANTITIDSYFKNIKIDFFKIDVEGWEKDVLKGSDTVLKREYPIKVVIATYHRQNDEKEIMQMLIDKGFTGFYSPGFVTYIYQKSFEYPYLRRCLIRAEKQLS